MQVEQATVSALRLFTAQPWVSSLSVGRKVVTSPVAVEKLLRPKFAKIKLLYDALQTTFLIF